MNPNWKQNYKAWLNELKTLRTKKAPKRVPVFRTRTIPVKVPLKIDYNNFYDDGITDRNYLTREELKWLI